MTDPTYPVFPIFSFLSFVLVLIPLPWHLQAWNAGTCLYMFWTAIALLNQFINSIVWHGNALNPAPIWCDISIRIIIGAAVGIPAASLCINRRLYKIATMTTVGMSRGQKRRAVIEDVLIGLGIPLLQMPLQYVVAGHRFNIYEDIGCYPFTYNTWLAYLLSACWPVAIGLVSAIYCVLSLLAFYKKRSQFQQFLSHTSSMSVSRYFRLMALATAELLCTTPFASYSIYLNLTTTPVNRWISWSDTHFNFSRVEQVPATLWRLSHQTVISFELSRWMLVVCGLVFFGFFGFAEEARRNYRLAALAIANKFGMSRWLAERQAKKQSTNMPYPIRISGSSGVLPVFVQRPPVSSPTDTKRGSLDTVATLGTEKHASTTVFSASNPMKTESYDECYGHAY